MARVDYRLNVIVDAGVRPRADLADLAAAAARGGATLIQYRDKASDHNVLIAIARAIKQALAGSGVPLVINDHVEVALAAGADGVHLGQDDGAPKAVRQRLGAGAIIGRTVQRPAHARAIVEEPVDYACIGGVFPTTSKINPNPPIGVDGFAALRGTIAALRPDLPVGAIAGITPARAAALIEAGADGIAVVGAVLLADDSRAAAQDLRRIVDAALQAREAKRSRR